MRRAVRALWCLRVSCRLETATVSMSRRKSLIFEIPTDRTVLKRAGWVRLRRAVVEPVGPSRRVRVTVCPHAKHADDGPVGVLSPLAHAIEIVVGQ